MGADLVYRIFLSVERGLTRPVDHEPAGGAATVVKSCEGEREGGATRTGESPRFLIFPQNACRVGARREKNSVRDALSHFEGSPVRLPRKTRKQRPSCSATSNLNCGHLGSPPVVESNPTLSMADDLAVGVNVIDGEVGLPAFSPRRSPNVHLLSGSTHTQNTSNGPGMSTYLVVCETLYSSSSKKKIRRRRTMPRRRLAPNSEYGNPDQLRSFTAQLLLNTSVTGSAAGQPVFHDTRQLLVSVYIRDIQNGGSTLEWLLTRSSM